ncbi:MAG: cob(I)yrinic acid a,c-diamide adenosyltransferase [Tannerellaceae bacterium]|jgi:cob(I)alamin adenosyltransferase|nr:cob(I)yrinic acid a,c-diamide adenosyltransferase [Tannerellaceae bacterium]
MNKSMIYTRTGDGGTTSLAGGKRVSKTDIRLECYGTTDELNAWIGLLTTGISEKEDLDFLLFLQHKLFSVGASLATDKENAKPKGEPCITPENISRIEREIDRIDRDLPRMKHFILPGGCRTAAQAHLCRTVCRRAERLIYRLHEKDEVEESIRIFMNRLSDYFFVLARKECVGNNAGEIIWDYSCT